MEKKIVVAYTVKRFEDDSIDVENAGIERYNWIK